MSQHGCPERLSNRSKFQEESGTQPTMELLVETLTGTAFEMTVSPSDTIFAIKSKIFRVEGIPVSQQHLLYNLKELEDSSSLRSLSISSGARLRLVLGMRGGPVSTRRLPPPAPHAEPLADIDRLFHSNRDEVEWSNSGCKVTVLVFRDGERVNMVRVRENNDGTYSPLDTNKYSASLTQLSECGSSEVGAGALRENAVTMGKMLELRRRMESLTLQRAAVHSTAGEKVEIQKTRSEEALPTHAREEPPAEPCAPYHHHHDCFALHNHNNYTRYSYECGFGSRYTLLPPIGAREECAPDADARHPPIQRRQRGREGEECAILEECLGGEQCRAASPRPAHSLHPVSQDLGELVGAGGCAWRGHSASALQLRAAAPRPQLHAPFSSSTSELENLQRNSRLLPGLSRARPREHLHLSDEGLHLRREPAPAPLGNEERLYMRRDTSQNNPSALEERLYMRRESSQRDASNAEDRLYNRRDTSQEDRLYNRKDSDRLFMSGDPAEDIFLRELPHPPGLEDRLFSRRDMLPYPPGLEPGHLYREPFASNENRLLGFMRRELSSQLEDDVFTRREPEERNSRIQKIEEREREGSRGGEAPPPAEPAPELKEKKIRLRCGWCKKRLSVATVHRCRCGGAWCAAHRYAEVHGCAWDYKAHPAPAAPHHQHNLPRI